MPARWIRRRVHGAKRVNNRSPETPGLQRAVRGVGPAAGHPDRRFGIGRGAQPQPQRAHGSPLSPRRAPARTYRGDRDISRCSSFRFNYRVPRRLKQRLHPAPRKEQSPIKMQSTSAYAADRLSSLSIYIPTVHFLRRLATRLASIASKRSTNLPATIVTSVASAPRRFEYAST